MTAEVLGRSLEEFVREIYIILLGLGFALFAERFLSEYFATGTLYVSQLLYFVAIYYFLSYDWMAFNVLIDRYPYPVGPDAPLQGHGRFYADLVALLVKSLLIFVATQPLDVSNVQLAALALAAWHGCILTWYYFLGREVDDLPRVWPAQAAMSAVYVGFAGALTRAPAKPRPLVADGVVILLALIVFGYAASRKRTLAAQFG